MRIVLLMLMAVLAACGRVGTEIQRRGEEIVVCGRLVRVGTPVVLWMDPGGYDGYRTEKRFAPWEKSAWEAGGAVETPNRYGVRKVGPEVFERVRGGGWSLEELRDRVDQVVVHYDVAGTSRTCFRVLHDARGLSCHFLLDVDGTIYQTLDVKERAWHATIANDRSIGVEIAHIGAYPPAAGGALPATLETWYARDEKGWKVTLPATLGDGGVRLAGPWRPARPEPIEGVVQGKRYVQFDFTAEQYESLARLITALHRTLPGIRVDYPRDERGVLTRTLSPEEFAGFSGVLGHWHVQENKIDPGPAFDWERVMRRARSVR